MSMVVKENFKLYKQMVKHTFLLHLNAKVVHFVSNVIPAFEAMVVGKQHNNYYPS